MAADWVDDERRAWALNSLRDEIRDLRSRASRCRVRFADPSGTHYQPAAWVAAAYDAAADTLQECIDDLPEAVLPKSTA